MTKYSARPQRCADFIRDRARQKNHEEINFFHLSLRLLEKCTNERIASAFNDRGEELLLR